MPWPWHLHHCSPSRHRGTTGAKPIQPRILEQAVNMIARSGPVGTVASSNTSLVTLMLWARPSHLLGGIEIRIFSSMYGDGDCVFSRASERMCFSSGTVHRGWNGTFLRTHMHRSMRKPMGTTRTYSASAPRTPTARTMPRTDRSYSRLGRAADNAKAQCHCTACGQQGSGKPGVPDDTMDPDGQPDGEENVDTPQDLNIANAVKARAWDAINMLFNGNIWVNDNTTGTLCVLCGSSEHAFPSCRADSQLRQQITLAFDLVKNAIKSHPNALPLSGSSPSSSTTTWRGERLHPMTTWMWKVWPHLAEDRKQRQDHGHENYIISKECSS